MAERKVTEGGSELEAFIRRTGQSIPTWCDEHGVDRYQVQKLVNGAMWKRVSVDLALAIERATRGRIKVARFASRTATAAGASKAA